MRHWLTELYLAKKGMVRDDPQLFETYAMLISQYSVIEDEHIAGLLNDLRRIIQAGVTAGSFTVTDVDTAAVAVLSATARFHNPQYAQHWVQSTSDDVFIAVVDLILAGLTRAA